ncbi:leucine efflux protein LeuE [Wielerella bovis]|uniref:leucine efflux protein LeuE n=1 Tax=Wielerella bovis TaxID=2917790 RepID=UPI002018FC15|nr:leucine efflux protein LeuE [Wielerella bovis]ULJ60529.1 leucine efflux protein LeuE [Wielerella bovis]
MYGIVDYPLYFIGVLTIIFLPGPNSMYCLAVATHSGVREATKTMAAVFIGDSILMALAAGGAASVLRTNPMLFNVLKIIGGLYLAYLGVQMLRDAWQGFQAALSNPPNRQPEQAMQTISEQPHENVFKHALTLSLMNPKAILFFLSFFIPFVDPNYPHPALSFLLLAITLQVVSMCYLLMLAIAGSKLAAWFGGKPKVGAAGLGLVGLLFCTFAVKLWFAAI